MNMLEMGIWLILIALAILSFASLYRSIKGPSVADRIIAINVISTKVTVMILLISIVLNQTGYMDVALIYALVGFITTLSVSKYLAKGKLYE
jgi:multicomponent Na+:H+ antiporter subunit F